jgi:hypothetical protein
MMDAMQAKAYVKGYWDRRIEWAQIRPEAGVLNGFGEIYTGCVKDYPQPEAAAWLAAAEFTQAHEEEVRQLRRQIELIEDQRLSVGQVIDRATFGTDGFLADCEREYVTWSRTLALLEQTLQQKLRGVRGKG